MKVRRPAAGLAQELPFPGQQFVQTRGGQIGDTGENVGEPCLGIDLVEPTGRDHRQHDGGTVGATLAAGEGPVAPSQGGTSQCALSTIGGQADPAIVEEAAEVVPAPEHVVDRFQDFGGAQEGFALTQQPDVHVVEKRLALFLAHGASLVGAANINGALDLEQRIEASDRLHRDRRDRFALLTFASIFLDAGFCGGADPQILIRPLPVNSTTITSPDGAASLIGSASIAASTKPWSASLWRSRRRQV